MPIDTFKPKGPSKLANPGSGGQSTKQYPIIGIVKDNIDPTRSGRIRVALQDGKGPVSPDDDGGWVTVQHLTTFFGVVRANAGTDSEDYGSYINNSSSYGQWQAPPDIGTKVICIFVNGDTSAGYYIGSIPEPETLQMVPAIGASEVVTLNKGEARSFGGATRLPVTNLNTNNKDKADSNEFIDTPRPVHSYTASIMNQQGILRDPIRGPISSSASREAASRVGWGVSTPGRPIYEGGFTDENIPENLDQSKAEQLKVVARRGGHSIVMDDGDIIGRDQLIRIRTSLGHQILMSDDGQTLMILHSNGQSYIELGKEGTVDIFSTNSINMRTQGDFNIHADRDINMHAMENFNLQAKNIHTNSEEVTKSRAGKDYNISSLNNFTVKSGAAAAINAGGQASLAAGAEAFINGSKVNLNSGSASTSSLEVPIISLNAQADTLFDKQVGWVAAPAKLLSIASRAPAHYPWVSAGMGVDIKNSPDAEANLPAPPSSAVQQLNKQAEISNPAPPAIATVASVPATPSVSPTIDSGTTNAVLAAAATSAAEGPASEAVEAGAGIVKKSNNSLISGINSALGVASAIGGVVNTANQAAGSVNQAVVAIGSFAQSPKQLTQSGVLKPGADRLVNGLASSGKTLINSMPATLFAGKSGAESMEKLAENSSAQTAALVSVMQTSQQQLTEAGVMNGSESTEQTAGLISASAALGTEVVVDTVKQFSDVTGALDVNTDSDGIVVALPAQPQTPSTILNNARQTTAALSNVATGTQNVIAAIGTGMAAARLADGLGGLGGISNSLKAMASGIGSSLTGLLDSVKGVAGSAFSAIKDSFGKLEANKPQFLTDSAKEKASQTATTENSTSDQGASTNSLTGTSSAAGSIATDAARLANDTRNTVNSITGAISPIANLARLPDTINVGTINNSLVNGVNQSTSAITRIGSAGQQVSSLIDSVTSAPDNLANSISGAFDNINSMAGAATALKDGKAGLANAAKKTQAGGLAAKASQLSSGVSNLPGGIKAFSNVTDKAEGAINKIPGTSKLTGALNDLQTGITSGAGQVSSVLNSASDAASSAASSLGLGEVNAIAGKSGGLTSAIMSKLPIGQATQLLSSVSALGAGGTSPIKLPSFGINTSDRTGISIQIKDVLGNPKIPEPNLLGDIKDETITALDNKLIALRKEQTRITQEILKYATERNTAYNTIAELEKTLPAGDPRIQAEVAKYTEAVNELSVAIAKTIKVSDEISATRNAALPDSLLAINNTNSPEELLDFTRRTLG